MAEIVYFACGEKVSMAKRGRYVRESDYAALLERHRRIVAAASNCVPDNGQSITFEDLIIHIDELRAALAEEV